METCQGETMKDIKLLEGKLISISGRLVLINYVVSNMVLYDFFLPAT
jgi:hypothetical protein